MNADRIERQILLRATPERAWQALCDSKRFGSWFGIAFAGPFIEGGWLTGIICPTRVDSEIAKFQQPFAGTPVELTILRIETLRLLSFRWHPTALEPDFDRLREPTTLVEFELRPNPEGVLLSIRESGFDQFPAQRGERARRANDAGWEMQTHLIAKYLKLPDQP
jgi:uncharacterized protein YndB with AHSA1/START domain